LTSTTRWSSCSARAAGPDAPGRLAVPPDGRPATPSPRRRGVLVRPTAACR
jgi:hypothetical protein